MQDFSGQIVGNTCITPDGTVLHSKYRHDYVEHLDKHTGELYFLDGGNDYVRCSKHGRWPIVWTVTMKDLHSSRRQLFAWKTYGRDGEFAPKGKWVYLNEMSTEHIQNILDYQPHIRGTYVEVLFKDELEFRIKHGIN